jgi:IclR family acetate operon transcriptional repressor
MSFDKGAEKNKCLGSRWQGTSLARQTTTQKALLVVEALSRGATPRHLNQVAEEAGLPKPSVHRVLQELSQVGFVARHPRGAYGPGYRLLGMASQVLAEDEGHGTVREVLCSLRDATGYTVHVGVLSVTEAVYVYKVASRGPYQMSSRVGTRLGLHCTAIGKSILAALGAAELEDILWRLAFVKRTENTVTSRTELLKELRKVRRQGFAVDNEENEYDVRCVAAPVLYRSGALFGALSVSALTFELSMERAHEIAPIVENAAQHLTQVLSGAESGLKADGTPLA